jgi:hypothetical protein
VKPRSILALLAIAVIAGVFTIQITSCTVLGFGIGAIVDANRHTRYDPTVPTRVITVKRGTDIQIRLDDNSIASGRFDGWTLVGDSAYTARYAAWRERHTGALRPPALGDTVTLSATPAEQPERNHESDITGEPAPADPFAAREAVFGGWAPYSVMIALRGKPFVAQPFAEINTLAHVRGDPVPRDSIRAWLAEEPPPPMRIAIKIHAHGETREFPAERVTLIAIGAPKNGKTVGALVGLGVDLTLFIAAGIEAQSSGCNGATYSGSGGTSLLAQPARARAPAPAVRRP